MVTDYNLNLYLTLYAPNMHTYMKKVSNIHNWAQNANSSHFCLAPISSPAR